MAKAKTRLLDAVRLRHPGFSDPEVKELATQVWKDQAIPDRELTDQQMTALLGAVRVHEDPDHPHGDPLTEPSPPEPPPDTPPAPAAPQARRITPDELATEYNSPEFIEATPGPDGEDLGAVEYQAQLESEIAEELAAMEGQSDEPFTAPESHEEHQAPLDPSQAELEATEPDEPGPAVTETDEEPPGPDVSGLPILNVSQIAALRKIPVLEELAKRGLNTAGNVDALRDRLYAFELSRTDSPTAAQ